MFDSPLFWIFLIWWLLSAVAGNKKRKLKAQQAARQEIDDEQDFSLEVDFEQSDAPPIMTPEFQAEPEPIEEPRRPKPPPALADIIRGLGLLPDQPLAPVFVPEFVEEEPEPLPDIAEEVTIEESAAIEEEAPVAVSRPEGLLDRLDRLPPLQRAIILKELLDRPKALRRPGFF